MLAEVTLNWRRRRCRDARGRTSEAAYALLQGTQHFRMQKGEHSTPEDDGSDGAIMTRQGPRGGVVEYYLVSAGTRKEAAGLEWQCLS